MDTAEIESWRGVEAELLPRLWQHLLRQAGHLEASSHSGELRS